MLKFRFKIVNLNNVHSLQKIFKVDLKEQLRSIRQWCLDVLNFHKQIGDAGLTIIRDMTEVSKNYISTKKWLSVLFNINFIKYVIRIESIVFMCVWVWVCAKMLSAS